MISIFHIIFIFEIFQAKFQMSKARASVGKQPIKKDDPKSSVPNTHPIAEATPSAIPSAGNPFAAEPASTPAPSLNPFASNAQNATATASANPFAATSTNTAPAPSSNPFASQQPPQVVPFGTQQTAESSSSVQNPFSASSVPCEPNQQSAFRQMDNAPRQNLWASTLAPQELPKNPFTSGEPPKNLGSSWIFHEKPVRNAVHSALVEGLTFAEFPVFFEKNCPELRIPSASELWKYFLQIVLQENQESGPDEAAEPQTTPQRLESAHAAVPAARQNLEDRLYADLCAKERKVEALKLRKATDELLRMRAAARPQPAPTPEALFWQLITAAAPLGAFDGQGGSCCSICLEPFFKGAAVRQLKCGHLFHALCCDQWFGKSLTCGFCRQALF